MDCFMNNAHQINWLTSIILAMLRAIRANRHHLDKDATKILIQALVMSKLDYCNSLLVGSVEYQLGKLQHIQNIACRIVCKLSKYDHISWYMANLHHLWVCEWIKYKFPVILFRNKENTMPIYIKELLPSKKHYRYLRSSVSDYITPAFCKTSLAQNSSFALAGPHTQNSLPLLLCNIISMKDFKGKCKDIPCQGIIW